MVILFVNNSDNSKSSLFGARDPKSASNSRFSVYFYPQLAYLFTIVSISGFNPRTGKYLLFEDSKVEKLHGRCLLFVQILSSL